MLRFDFFPWFLQSVVEGIHNNPVTDIGILGINFKAHTGKKDCNKLVNTQSTTGDKLKYHNTQTRREYHKTGAGSTHKEFSKYEWKD